MVPLLKVGHTGGAQGGPLGPGGGASTEFLTTRRSLPHLCASMHTGKKLSGKLSVSTSCQVKLPKPAEDCTQEEASLSEAGEYSTLAESVKYSS